MAAYYNEFDPKAAAWLRELIKQGHIADGVVDDRSIEDVTPTELTGFTQCHFFAGIGVWSYALRRAGWADDRPIWTGSCPCQPFSAAGKGAGFDDERHLWPAFHHLISQCRPPIVLGEQVASKDGLGWLDLVQADLEATGYASGAVDLCAAGVGAPHIRQRLWWVGTRLADTASGGQLGAINAGERGTGMVQAQPSRGSGSGGLADTKGNGWDEGKSFVGGGAEGIREGRSERRSADGAAGGLANTRSQHLRGELGSGNGKAATPEGETRQWERGGDNHSPGGSDVRLADADHASERMVGSCGVGLDGGATRDARVGLGGSSNNGRLADTSGIGREWGQGSTDWSEHDGQDAGRQSCNDGAVGSNEVGDGSQRPGPTNGHWRDADWLFCRDGKWRPVVAKPQPLVDGSARSLGRVRDEFAENLKEKINAWSVENKISGTQGLRDLLIFYGEKAASEWPIGGIPGLCETPFLLSFLRQLEEQGWRKPERLPVSCKEVGEAVMRSMWVKDGIAGASRQHGLEGQSSREYSDALSVLSSLLACGAREAWGIAYDAYAETQHPLTKGAANRVMRLRGYGNAIVAQAAQAFIESVMD